jgi:hypothetical protein
MSPRRVTSLVLTHPEHLTDAQRERRHELTTGSGALSVVTVGDLS